MKGLFQLYTLKAEENGQHFPDGAVKCIFVNENMKLKQNFTKACSHVSKWYDTSVSSGNGLAQLKTQT